MTQRYQVLDKNGIKYQDKDGRTRFLPKNSKFGDKEIIDGNFRVGIMDGLIKTKRIKLISIDDELKNLETEKKKIEDNRKLEEAKKLKEAKRLEDAKNKKLNDEKNKNMPSGGK